MLCFQVLSDLLLDKSGFGDVREIIMNINTLSILSDAISDVGSWHRWFIRDDMVQVQFCDIMLYDENTSEKESHRTDVLTVRFSGNAGSGRE